MRTDIFGADMRSSIAISLALLASGAAIPAAIAQTTPTGGDARPRFQLVEGRVLRVDGRIQDWSRIPMVQLGSGDDAAFRYAFAYDDEGVFVGVEVSDERVIRNARPGTREDAVVVTFATPQHGGDGVVTGYAGTEVWLYPGIEGQRDAAALVGTPGRRARPARNIDVVEGPRRRGVGYALEAYIPFDRIAGAERFDGARAAIRMQDVDSSSRPTIEATLASASGEPAELPLIDMSSGTHSSIRALRENRSLGNAPIAHDLWGDVFGDGREERVVFIGNSFAVMGAGYRDGQSYDFEQMPVRGGDDVQRARLEDVTGDGKAEIVVRLRERDRFGLRAVWKVYGVVGDARASSIDVLFSAEVFERNQRGIVRNTVSVRHPRRRNAPPHIDVAIAGAEGVTQATYRRPPPDDDHTLPILLPWGPVRTQVYQYTNGAFALVSSEPNPDAHVEPTATPEQAASGRRPAGPTTRPPPQGAVRRPSGPSVTQRIAQARRDQGIGASVPIRFEQRANVAERGQHETVAVLGGGLLVHGDDYLGGRSYFYMRFAENPDDIRGLRVADVTGDGRAEIMLTLRQNLGEYQRDVLVVHHFRDGAGAQGFPNLLQVEIARYHGDAEQVVNQVQIRGSGRRALLRITPGRARGWDAETWPFSGFADDGVGHLLVPWADGPVTYRFREGRLIP